MADWTTFYMSMAFFVSQKSKDNSTKVGAVIVSPDNRVLSVGYNGPFAGCDDEAIPWDERPEKYNHILHAEENALYNFNGVRSDMNGATIYVTTRPCTRCLRGIIQSGINHLVYQTRADQLKMFSYEPNAQREYDRMIKLAVDARDFKEVVVDITDDMTVYLENVLQKVTQQENK